MQALVLVGGEGTRLRPLTLTQPKPAIALVDRPFIRFMVDWLARHGVDEVIMACGFRPDALRLALGDSAPDGTRIRYLEEEEPLGTAGPIRLAAEHGLLGDRFMVLNGDVLADLDLTALQAVHAERGDVATLALFPVADPTAYGLVRREGPGDSGDVLEFVEKPEPEQIDTDEISAGAYVLERAILDLIPAGRAVSIEREVFPHLVGHGLGACRLVGYWMDIGTPERYLQASWDILEGKVETDYPRRGSGTPLIEDGAAVSPGAEIAARAVVRAGSAVAAGAVIEESVLLGRCAIGERAEIRGSILAPNVQVGEGARVGPGAVVGEGARIAAGAELGEDARIAPAEEVGV
jgi:mannose-1-phosphate guanylyltransferase